MPTFSIQSFVDRFLVRLTQACPLLIEKPVLIEIKDTHKLKIRKQPSDLLFLYVLKSGSW